MIEEKINLTEKEKKYIESTYPTIGIFKIILKSIVGAFIVLLSCFLTPSAEGKLPFSNYFSRLKTQIKFTKYKKAVNKKLENKSDKRNEKILEKLNKEDFVLDKKEENNIEDKNIEEIYSEYMKKREEKEDEK